MTAPRGDAPRPFGPDELAGVPGIKPDELSAEVRLARDIETVAARGTVRPSPDFADRVMAAIEAEPVPAPVVAAGSALRHGAALGLLASLRDAFRVAFGGGFPVAVRAQAFALVLLVSGVVAGGGVVTAGALGLFDDRESPPPTLPSPSVGPLPTVAPSMSFDVPSSPPSPVPSPGETPGAESPSPEDTDEPEETKEPRETGEAGDDGGQGSDDDSSGSGSGGGDNSGKGSDDERETPRPTHDAGDDETPRPTDDPDRETPRPTDDPDRETPEPDDD